MVLSSVRYATGKSKPIIAIPVELNVNLPGVVIEVHLTDRDHRTFAPAIGRQYTHRISLTGRDTYALQRWY